MSDDPKKPRRGRGEGRLFRRGRTWWIQYSVRGKVFRESSKSDDEDVAKKLLRHRLVDADRGQLTGPTAERLTLLELLRGLENNQQQKRNRTSSSRTQKLLVQYFGPRARAVDLTAVRIARYAEDRKADGLSNASVNRETAALRRAFRIAIKNGQLSAAQVPSFPHYSEKGNERQGFLEPAEFRRLVDALPEYLRDFVSFLYLTGWRIGEVRTLEWRDVDLDGRIIRLRAEISKNKLPRMMKLAGETLAIIERAHRRRRLDSRYVFYRVAYDRVRKHETVWPVGDFRKQWKRAIEAAGLNPGLIRHDFRRSAIRNAVRAGIPEAVAMRMSGHKTRSVFERYNIVSESDLDDAARRMDEYVREREAETSKVVSLTR